MKCGFLVLFLLYTLVFILYPLEEVQDVYCKLWLEKFNTYGPCAAHAVINESAIIQLKGKSFKCLLSEYCFQVFLTLC